MKAALLASATCSAVPKSVSVALSAPPRQQPLDHRVGGTCSATSSIGCDKRSLGVQLRRRPRGQRLGYW
eukprot:3261654-Rhodomonas_salina.2